MNEMSRRDHAAIAANFATLLFGEQLILWGVRMWVRAFTQDANIQSVLRNGFKLANAADAHPALDAMMTIFSSAGYGTMDIRCPQCTEISPDEHRILAALAAWQREPESRDGEAYLRCWLPTAGLRLVREPMQHLAITLAGVGLMIRPRPWVLNTGNLNMETHWKH